MAAKKKPATNAGAGNASPPVGEPKRYLTEEFHRGRREDHTPEKFVPAAMNFALAPRSRTKPARVESPPGSGRIRRRSPSTYLLNRSNVKRKPGAR